MEIKSTNINKTNNYISFQMIKKKTTTYVDGNPVWCLLWTKPLHMKLDFGAISQKQQSTEPVSEVRHIIPTPSQPVFVLFLYLIL
jgi:hypothetical protein